MNCNFIRNYSAEANDSDRSGWGKLSVNTTRETLALHPQGSFSPISFTVLAIFEVLPNSAALFHLALCRSLHTAFDITVMHLFLQNILSSGVQYSLLGAGALYPGAWRFGKQVCDLLLLSQVMLTSAVANTHSLIALNRAWAILHPFPYRIYNTRRMALCTCLGFWTSLLLVAFPFWLNDFLYGRPDFGTYFCRFNNGNTQMRYVVLLSVWVYSMPTVVVVVVFVIVAVDKPSGQTQQ
ncbi:hypothetical protein BV898_19524 [Hypsibius exemplaris]|uniref:G-protein coupled receptors family 1 profile domain-containing protein n=1 Tax=Hypsibius exemplaris TaxID=2072580 RepID=A0A9X6NJ84_HYPEX|nr:hypothetical protein BV898_19524 [Hypsibius exemplaris]